MIKSNWFRGALDVFMIAFFFFVPHFGLMPIYVYPEVLLFVCWLYLKLFRKNFSSIGFRFSDFSLHSLLIGCLLGAAYFFLDDFVLSPIWRYLFHIPPADVKDFAFVKNSLTGYLLILLIAWVLGVPYEEIIFRGFMLTRIRKMVKAGKMNLVISGLITSVVFGLYHLQQGFGGIVNAFVFGVALMFLYKLFKGNLWYLIFFHAMYDTVAITAIRWG